MLCSVSFSTDVTTNTLVADSVFCDVVMVRGCVVPMETIVDGSVFFCDIIDVTVSPVALETDHED